MIVVELEGDDVVDVIVVAGVEENWGCLQRFRACHLAPTWSILRKGDRVE